MATGRVLLAGWDVAVAVFFLLFFLDHVDVRLHDRFFFCILLVCLGPEPILRRLLNYHSAALGPARAALCGVRPPRRRVRDDLSYILATAYGSASKLLARPCGEGAAFLSGSTSAAVSFVHRDSAATELVPCGEESLACVTFAVKLFLFGAELVPERVEGFIMGAVDNVAEPEEEEYVNMGALLLRFLGGGVSSLVQHGVDHFFQREELPFIVGITQAETYFLALVPIQT